MEEEGKWDMDNGEVGMWHEESGAVWSEMGEKAWLWAIRCVGLVFERRCICFVRLVLE